MDTAGIDCGSKGETLNPSDGIDVIKIAQRGNGFGWDRMFIAASDWIDCCLVDRVVKYTNRRGYAGYRKMVDGSDGRDKQLCEDCNLLIASRMMKKHRNSILHRQGSRIRALLSKQCISFLEISRRFGCSYEYVRQIAKRLGFNTGNERIKACTLARKHSEARANPLLQSFLLAVHSKGLSAELIENRNRVFRDRVRVGPKIVFVRRASQIRSFVRINRPTVSLGDFCAFRLPDDNDGWMIVPWRELPPKQTMFALEPNLDGLGLTHNRRHDWPKFVEAWELLRNSNAGHDE